MDRRDFLKKTAALSAAAGVAGAAEGAKGERIRCGLLGVDHADALDALEVLKQSNDFDLAGVCEPDASVRGRFAGEKALEGVLWLDESDLLADESVRMVAIEGGVPRLLDLARRAVDAGKHIHLDKPAGTSLPAFRALLDEAERRDLLVQMGYMYRYNPGFDLIRRACTEGWLGRVYSIQASMCTDISTAKRRRMAFHHGGILFELGCHLIDIILVLLGPPSKVTPFIRHDDPRDDGLADNTLAVLEYDQTMVVIEVGAMEPRAFAGRRFKIVGNEGAIVLEPIEPPIARISLRDPSRADLGPDARIQDGVARVVLEDLERHVLDFQDFARAIRGESALAYSKEHDFNVQKTVLEACRIDD